MEILGLRSSTPWRNYGDPGPQSSQILKPMDFYGNPRPQILNSMEKLWRSRASELSDPQTHGLLWKS
jgi:hypothetical protein